MVIKYTSLHFHIDCFLLQIKHFSLSKSTETGPSKAYENRDHKQ